MGQVSSALDPDNGGGVVSIPDGYTTPSFPSLYLPTLDSTMDQRGIFIYEAEPIWHFTLYWTLLLTGSLFFVCSVLASFSLFLSLTVFWPDDPSRHRDRDALSSHRTKSRSKWIHTLSTPSTPAAAETPAFPSQIPLVAPAPPPGLGTREKREGKRIKIRKRPPLWPVFLIPFVALAVAAFISIITGTVVGFALAAIYSAGGFSMSTWIPFLWALIQVLVLIISSYSTLTSIL